MTWDADSKQTTAKPGEDFASLYFLVTNTSPTDVTIDHVQTSCGCTVAKLPSQPWTLHPQTGGKIEVTVDLRGKRGSIFKTVTIIRTNAPVQKQLGVTITIPELRTQNQAAAQADRQAVFKADCARCHAEPARGKTGQELFAVACGICHEAEHRASMVPDLHALNHDTDRIYWQQWISTGKPGSLMPGFAAGQGGPLTRDQIESLADYLDKAVPHTAQAKPPAQVNTALPQTIPLK